MSEAIQGKVFEYIEAMAVQLGVAAEYVWTLMIQQMVVEGIVYSTTIIMSLVLFISVTVWAYKKYEDTCEDIFEFIGTLTGIATLVSLLITFIFVPGYVMQAINPEYYAIQKILEAIK